MQDRNIITTHQVSKTVLSGQQPLTILTNINLQIQSGESVAILGPSGSGKTTLLSLLAGLDTPTDGEIHVNQTNITELNEDQRAQLRAQLMSFVFQNFMLLPSLSALDNVSLPLELLNRKNYRQQAKDWLANVGLADRMHHYPKQLSGGEQQRVAIARAFVTQPEILFADEPTGNLDTESAANIIELLTSLNRDSAATIVVVTHDQQLANICSRQLKLVEGKLHD